MPDTRPSLRQLKGSGNAGQIPKWNGTAFVIADDEAGSNSPGADAVVKTVSGSSVTIGAGTKSFATSATLTVGVGSWMLVVRTSDISKWMLGQVSAVSSNTVELNVTDTNGSGTFSDWTFTISGPRGATGATGPQGDAGATGPQGADGATHLSPANVEITGDVSVIAGANLVLVCTALGEETLSYQWKKGGVDVATGYTLTVANAAIGDSGAYTCVVTNAYGSAGSNTLNVVVQEPPAIATETPPDTTPTLNALIDFTLTATGTAIEYEWQYSPDDNEYTQVANGGTTSGAATNTLTHAATVEHEGYYRCRVFNAVGEVFSTPMWIAMSPPVIVTQPEGVGSDGSVAVVASGVGTLTYQWLYGGVGISGATEDTYLVDPAAVDILRGLKFSCRVSNEYGSVTSAEVGCRPFLLGSSSNVGGGNQRANGYHLKLVAGIVGPPGTTYSWKRNGTSCGGDVDVFGDSVPTLTIKEPQMGDEGTYVCRGSNALGYVDAAGIEVDMTDNDNVHKLPRNGSPSQLNIFDDETLVTEIVALMPEIVQACGYGGCAFTHPIQYQFNGAVVPLVDGDYNYTLKQGAFIRRDSFTPPQEGEMSTSPAAWKTMSVTLDGATIPSGAVWKFLIRQQSGSYVPASDPAAYYVPISNPWVDIAGGYTTTGVYAGDSTLASFQAFVITKAAVTSITSGPLVFVIGDNLSIDVAATGDNLLYAWYRDGVRCPLQSGPNFSKLAAQGDAGDYTAKVGNESYTTQHCVTSSACVVDVIGITATPASFSASTADTVTAQFCGTPADVEFALVVDGSVGTYQDDPELVIGDNFGVPLKIRIRHKTETSKFHDSGEFTVTQVFKWKCTYCGGVSSDGFVSLDQLFANNANVSYSQTGVTDVRSLGTATATGQTVNHNGITNNGGGGTHGNTYTSV